MKTETKTGIILSNRAYDITRSAAQYWLPASGALYFALASIWGLPNAEQVLGTIAALDIFLGAIMGFSKSAYDNADSKYDGALVIDTSDDEKDTYSFEWNTPLEELRDKNELSVKVKPLE